HQVDLRLAPLQARYGAGNGHLPRDFLFVIIGDRAAVVHASQSLRRARGVQHGGYQRGLAGVAVSHYGHVPDVRAFVDFHGMSLLLHPAVAESREAALRAPATEPGRCGKPRIGPPPTQRETREFRYGGEWS